MARPTWRDSMQRYVRNVLTSNLATAATSFVKAATSRAASNVVSKYWGSGAGSTRQAAPSNSSVKESSVDVQPQHRLKYHKPSDFTVKTTTTLKGSTITKIILPHFEADEQSFLEKAKYTVSIYWSIIEALKLKWNYIVIWRKLIWILVLI